MGSEPKLTGFSRISFSLHKEFCSAVSSTAAGSPLLLSPPARSEIGMASSLLRSLIRSSATVASSTARRFSGVSTQINKESLISEHTAKWMQDTSKKSPMELINEVPPIKVDGRIVACEGDSNPALGHPIEFICLDLEEPAVCKYCGLRYVQEHHH